ncbi:MAG: hypothetical protein EBZ47_09370 [Chlamydiae bacterium]|nr:hypothetical protein [Chlamydiota bacterium]
MIETGSQKFGEVKNVQPYKIKVETNPKTQKGTLALYSEVDGSQVGEGYAVLTQGTKKTKILYGDMSWMHKNGDTPEGTYKVIGYAGGNSEEPAFPEKSNKSSYGTGFIWLTPVDGDAKELQENGSRNVNEIGIHGGGSLLAAPFYDKQGWLNTQGCFRMQNGDVNQLIQDIKITESKEKSAGIKPSNTVEFHREDKLVLPKK